MNTPMNSLLSSTLNSATSASRFADEARANMARAHSSKAEMGGQFSQLLRGYDKPAESPKPAAEAKPAPAPAAPPKPEGKTETQRQEARSAAPKKSAEPQAKTAAKQPADPAKSAATATAATASSAQAAADESEALDGKRPDQQTAADVASPETSIVAELVAPLPIPLPLPAPVEVQSQLQVQLHLALQAQVEVPVPVPLASTPGSTGLPGTAKRQSGEIALTADGGESDDGKAGTTASTSTSANAGASASTSPSRVAHAAAEDAKAKAKDDSGAHSATDFATKLADAVQAQPAVLRSADSGPRAHIDAAALGGIAGASAPSAHTTLNPAGASAGASSPARVDVASSLYAPGFAPEMAARLSVLAADGVQSAQLHLNPADMGPVAVQIVLEGQQARIEFQADQADTRAVLERSLPDLAAALRDSGLTLSGGGVFQQFAGQDSSAAQDRNETNGSRRSGRAGADALPDTRSDLPARTAALARPTQGVVDLYA